MCEELEQLLAEAEKDIIVVAIDGMSGSGKSTLGQMLQERYDCNLFHMDDFFLRPEQRTQERLKEPGGNVDYERFKKEILDHLRDENGFTYQKYSCYLQKLDQKVEVRAHRLNIIEGSYSQHPYFGDIYDLRYFVEVSPEEQVKRIRKRNGDEMLKRFTSEWIPKENKYFETFAIQQKSNVIVGENIDLINILQK